jgi:hypothetical protein
MTFLLRIVFVLVCTSILSSQSAYSLDTVDPPVQDMSSRSFASINGILRDVQTGEPLPYANVLLKGTTLGAASDVHGYYVIIGIPEGEYTIVVSMIGYKTLEKTIYIISDGQTRYDFEISPEVVAMGEVVVTAERTRFEKDVDISRTNISNREIQSIPAFVEADVFRAIQQLPSVTAQNDLSAALIVRGGSPDENLVLLDGAEIYNPFHLMGLFSTFNPDAISDATFLAGGYPADNPGSLSSVLKVTSREGDSKQGKLFANSDMGKYWDISGFQGAVSLLSSKALVEGPFYNGAWILSGRRTYFDILADLAGEGRDWAYYFWDSQFKIFSDLSDQHRVTLSTFNGRDVVGLTADQNSASSNTGLDWDWGNSAISLKWRYIPGPSLLSEFIITRSNFDFYIDLKVSEIDSATGRNSEVNTTIANDIKDYTFTERLTWYASPRHTLTLGATVKTLDMTFNFNVDRVSFFDIVENPNVFSIFIQDKWEVSEALSLQIGVRGTKYELHEQLYLDPRLGFKYRLNDLLSLKGSWGRYNQFIFTTNDENEILRFVDFWQPVPKEYDAISNQHFILGLERWFNQGFTGTFEAYYKPYSNILTNNPNNNPAIAKGEDDFLSGTGSVWGVEILLKKTTGRLKGWLGYSYSEIERRFDFNGDGRIEDTGNQFSEIYAPIFSKPHSFSLAINYQLDDINQLSLSITIASGMPYTPVVGKVYHGDGDPGDPYSQLIDIRGRRNSSRYPLYFRCDVGWHRDVTVFGLKGRFNLQLMNVTNHFNALLYEWDHSTSPSEVSAIGMFPILPSLGFEFKL